MAKQRYSFPRKIEKILADEHGLTVSVSDNKESGGLLVTSGAYQETITGVITRDVLSDLAKRIKALQNG